MNPHEQGAGSKRGSSEESLAHAPPCPAAPECGAVTYIAGTETAECNFCGQLLNRADLARMLEAQP